LQEEHEGFFEEYFWYFIIPSGIILAISIFLEFFSELDILSQILAVISLTLSSYGVVKEAYEDLSNRKITANILMLIAAIASFFIIHGQEGATALILYAIAERLEEITAERSKRAIKELYELAPDETLIKIGNEFKSVPTDDVGEGSIIGIKPGMKVPLDGIIIKGSSYFDESAITGESLPKFKSEGNEVFAASMNSDSFVEVEVMRERNNTIVAQIAESIRIAQQNKSKKEKFIERFARYYTPIILLSSLAVMFIFPFFGLNIYDSIYRGLILLVVSCPCALTLSTPLANIASLTKLAKEGILVKGNRFIEKVEDIDIFAFDKTGTLTEGNLKVYGVYNYKGSKKEIIQIAASLEALSEHPIGKAIVKDLKIRNLELMNVEEFKIVKGKGIKGKINGELFYVGSERFFNEKNFKLPQEDLKEIESHGTLPVLVGNNRELLGIIMIRDVLRISSPILINALKKRGYETILISGDTQLACNTIGECLDIDTIEGGLLPDQKLKIIEEEKKEQKGVAMVGDGINDAPALALSDLGIAIGASATDLTLETADIIIMNDDLKKVITFLDITKKTNKIIKQNIWTSIIVKVSFAFLTVIGLMTLWLAVGIGDMGVSLLVLLNGLRVFRYKTQLSKFDTKDWETDAKMLICETCKTKQILPQHHGRDMIQNQNKLICWKNMIESEFIEPCEESLELDCPYCNEPLKVV
jgi:Cd2+/Zn2+-exporting ATPase